MAFFGSNWFEEDEMPPIGAPIHSGLEEEDDLPPIGAPIHSGLEEEDEIPPIGGLHGDEDGW